jgi:hypothetical protein
MNTQEYSSLMGCLVPQTLKRRSKTMRKFNLGRGLTSVGAVIVLSALLITGLTVHPSLSQPASLKNEDTGPQCTVHSARGTYGFAILGTISAIGLVSTGGATTFDGEGNQTGKFTVTSVASVDQFTFSGTYTVNPDCSGSATLNISPFLFGNGVVHLKAVGTNNNTELKWLVTDPGIFLAGTLTRQ